MRTRPEMVFYPQGPPTSGALAETCTRLVMALGGDLARVYDGPYPKLDRFIDQVRRLPVIRQGAERPIVVLTRTSPLAFNVLQTRREIEAAIPSLRHATWALFVDPVLDPFYLSNLKKLGALDNDVRQAPTWRASHGHEFVVLSPVVTELRFLAARVQRAAG